MDLRSILSDLKKKITDTASGIVDPTFNNGNNFWSGKGGQTLVDFQQSNPLSIFSQAGRDYRQQQANVLKTAPNPFIRTAGNFAEQFNQGAGSGIAKSTQGVGQIFQGGTQLVTDPLRGMGNIGQGAIKTFTGGGQLLAQNNPWVYGTKMAASLPGAEKLNLPDFVPFFGGANVPRVAAGMVEFAKNPAWGAIFPQTSKFMSAFGNSKTANLLFGSLSKGGVEGLIQGIADLPDKLSTVDAAKFLAKNVAFGSASELGFNSAAGLKFIKTAREDFKAYKDSFGGRIINVGQGVDRHPIEAWKYDLQQRFSLKNRPGFINYGEDVIGQTNNKNIIDNQTGLAKNTNPDISVKSPEDVLLSQDNLTTQATKGQNIQEFVQTKLNSRKYETTQILPAQPRTVKTVAKSLGIDVSNYNHTMGNYEVKHALNEHSGIKPLRPGEVPLTPEDIKLVPEIVSHPDSVGVSPYKTRRGLPALRYTKKLGDKVYYVEEIRNSSKSLAFKTMYKNEMPPSGNNALSMPSSSRQPSQVTTSGGNTSSISPTFNSHQELDDFLSGKINDAVDISKSPYVMSYTQPEGGVGVTKEVNMPRLNTLAEKQSQIPSVLPVSSTQKTPLPQLQTNQKVRIVPQQNSQPLESIIQQGRNQIGKTAEKPNQPIKKTLDDLYTQWVDRYNPIVKASQQAKKVLKIKNASLRPEADPEYLVRRLTGAGGIADFTFKTELNPILKEVEQFKIPKVDMDVYLANKRIAGFGQVGREIYGADPVKAKQIVSALEQKYGGIGQIADKLYQFQNKGFQEMVDAGFISPESAQTIKSKNPDYSPLYRVMDELDNYLGLPTRKTMQGTQPIVKIKGSERKIESPIESIIGNVFKQRAAIEKNRVAKSIVGLQEMAPELGFSKVAQSSPETLTIWNNGKREFWKVGQDIADVAKGANEEAMNMVLKVLQAPAALLRQGATGRNPEFMIPNVVRDQLDAGITSKYGYIPFVDFVSGLKSMIKNDSIYQKWQNSGAKIDLGELSGKKSISQLFNEKKASKNLFSWLGSGLDVLGKYSEQPTRVGLFKKAYNKTGNELLAAMESRDATVDFARMGSKMKVANSIVPFLNVGVQGFDKLIRSVKNNPAKVLLSLGLYAVAPQVAATVYNLTNHPDEYGEIPEYEKQSNFVLIKGRNENGTVDYVSIPKGNITPIAANPVQSFLEFLYGQDKTSFGEMATSVLSDVIPVLGQGSSLKEIGVKTLGSNLPQAIKPLAENLLNKSFYKYDPKKEQTKDIVPSYLQNKPAYQQTYEFTPQMYQKIGAIFNVSPLQVQNLMEGYLAGYTKIPSQIIESLYQISDNKPVSPNDQTILRRFIKQTYPTSGSSAVPLTKPEVPGIMERLSGKASASDGKITKYSDGTVRINIGGVSKAFDTEEEAKLGLAKYNFKQSDKNIETNGDIVFRKTKSGDVTTTPKIDYETSLNTQKMENAKKAKDFKTWMDLADTQFQNYQEQLKDPTLDELEQLELQQKIDALLAEAQKYQSYGGFKKGTKGAKITIKKSTVSKPPTLKITKPTLKITGPNIVRRTSSYTQPTIKINKPKLKSLALKRGVSLG